MKKTIIYKKQIMFVLLIFINIASINIFSQKIIPLDNYKNRFIIKDEIINLETGVKGFFISKLMYKSKTIYPEIALFEIIEKRKNNLIIEVKRWGSGWGYKDIYSYKIDKKSLSEWHDLHNLKNRSEIMDKIDKGIEYFNKRNYINAEIIFKKILSIDSENIIALEWLKKIKEQEDKNELKKNKNNLFDKMDFPKDSKLIMEMAKRVYLNNKGFWEAELPDSIFLVYIPEGKFIMGNNYKSEDEEPKHNVLLSSYWISKYEISFTQFDGFCKNTNKELPYDDDFKRDNNPVFNVSWKDTVIYCKWISKKHNLVFKLPTEAQWEKAARGDKDQRSFPWGFNKPIYKGNFYANFSDKKKDGYPFYAPIKSFEIGASPYGLINMSGNVSEWVNDWYDENYYSKSSKKNPKGPQTGKYKTIRGGSYSSIDYTIRASNREKGKINDKNIYTGFRIVLIPKNK